MELWDEDFTTAFLVEVGMGVLKYIVALDQLGWMPAGSLSYLPFEGTAADLTVDIVRADHGDQEARDRLHGVAREWSPIFAESFARVLREAQDGERS